LTACWVIVRERVETPSHVAEHADHAPHDDSTHGVGSAVWIAVIVLKTAAINAGSVQLWM
jgi:hypothetical protein